MGIALCGFVLHDTDWLAFHWETGFTDNHFRFRGSDTWWEGFNGIYLFLENCTGEKVPSAALLKKVEKSYQCTPHLNPIYGVPQTGLKTRGQKLFVFEK